MIMIMLKFLFFLVLLCLLCHVSPPVLGQLLSADDPLLADIRLAPWSLKTEHLPGGSGDPSGLAEPGLPVNRAHGSNAQGTQPHK